VIIAVALIILYRWGTIMMMRTMMRMMILIGGIEVVPDIHVSTEASDP